MSKSGWRLLVASAVCVASASGALGQGSPLLSAEDKFFLQTQLDVRLDDEAVCRLTQAEAKRLHRLIRAREITQIRAYLNNIVLDQVFDTTHHVARPDRCPRNFR